MRALLPLLILGFAASSFAYDLQSDTELSSGYTSQHLDLSHQIEANSFHFAGWSISAGGARSKNENSSTGESTYTNTRDLAGGLDFGYSKAWLFSISADQSETSETQFKQKTRGGNISYHHDLKDGRSWNIGFGYFEGDIDQHLSFQILNTKFERDVSLDQRENEFSIGWAPSAKFSIHLRGSVYEYNKSKQDLKTAFQNRFLNTFTTDLISSISGLPENKVRVSLQYQLNEDWDLSASHSQIKRIVDDSISRQNELIAATYLNHWQLGAGIGRLQMEEMTETSLLVQLGYSWY